MSFGGISQNLALVASTGNSIHNSAFSFDYSVGEMATPTISYYTMGFEQPFKIKKSDTTKIEVKDSVVYKDSTVYVIRDSLITKDTVIVLVRYLVVHKENPIIVEPKPTPIVPGLLVYQFLSPNEDGKNETFYIDGLSSYPENEVIIFDRMGKQVFRQKNYDNSWTGNNLPEDNYFYVVKIPSLNSEMKGGLVLTR
jgi:gliding motility-associated-like protein